MPKPELILEILDHVHQAGLDPQHWAEVIRHLTQHTKGVGGALHVCNTKGPEFVFGAAWNIDPVVTESYEQYYYRINPLTVHLQRQRAGAVVADHELLAREIVLRSEFYNEYMLSVDLGSSATAVLSNDANSVGALGIVGRRGQFFSADDMAVLKAVTPHLQRAIEMNRRLDRATADAADAVAVIDRLVAAILVVDGSGRVRRANPAAAAILRASDGLTEMRGQLQAADRATSQTLARLIQRAASPQDAESGHLVVARPSGLRGYILSVVPVRTADRRRDHLEPRVLVTIVDPDAEGQIGAREVLAHYGLTETEGLVLDALAAGKDLDEIAALNGTQTVTVRNHVKRVMAKTDTHRQSELVRLVLASRPPLRR